METLDPQTQWMSVMQTRSAGSLSGTETMAQWNWCLGQELVVPPLLTSLKWHMLMSTL